MLRNLFRRSSPPPLPAVQAIGVSIVTVEVGVPVPLALVKPDARHKDENGWCIYGYWSTVTKRWVFDLQSKPYPEDTHWISAHAEALPETCFAPGVES